MYCISIRTRGGINGQIYPFAWRSWRGQSPRELLRAKGYILLYIPSWVLKWTVFHFNIHRANNSLIGIIDNLSVYSLARECTVKYTPHLEVILKELNLSIPSFRMTRRYGSLRGPTSSSCRGFWHLAEVIFLFWQFLVSSSNLGNFY